MQISELRAMLEVLTDEDFRAVLPLERCNSDYVRLMEDRRLLREGVEQILSMCSRNSDHDIIYKCDELLERVK